MTSICTVARKKRDYARLWRQKRKEELGDFWTEYNHKWRANHPARYLLQKSKSRAKKLGLDFTITENDITIPDYCPVLGLKLELGAGKGKIPNSPSLDRIDNTKGYIPDNVQVMSWRANDLKANGTLEEFEKLVEFLRNGKEKERL